MKRLTSALLALLIAAPAAAAQRFPELKPEQMTPEQKKVADYLLKTRKNLSGPFQPWLRSPELADKLQAVGEYVRYNSAFPPALSEFAILVIAREWDSNLEWSLHYDTGIKAGIAPAILADVAASRRPSGMNEDQSLIYDLSVAMQRNKGKISDALFDKAKARFGEQKLMDLLGLNAYYAVTAMTINFGEVPLPEGTKPPLK